MLVKTLVKDANSGLCERAFCVVFEKDLDRFWPSSEMSSANYFK